MANLAFGLFCLVGGFVGLGLLVGWLAWGRQQTTRRSTPAQDNHAWLAQQVDREPLRSILSDDQRAQIREIYGQGLSPAEPAPVATGEVRPTTAADQPQLPEIEPVPYLTDAPSSSERIASPLAPPIEPPRAARPPKPVRDPLDPAALLLYAGAFLIAAAGVVYSAYNWADLAAWQKLGMLGLLTLAFGGIGWFLLANKRLRQAGETFTAIAAMLIPANAIAAWTVSQQTEASTGLIILVGAAITAVVHGVFSIRPGGTAYAYAAPAFGWLAIGALPAAVDTTWGWGGPLVILAVGLARYFEPRLPKILHHLQRPIRQTGLAAIVIAFLATSTSFPDGPGWLSIATFASLTFTFGVLASRSLHSVWGIFATITGLLTLFSLLGTLSDDQEWIDHPWFATPFLIVVSIGLIALGERGPAWLRRWGARLTLQIEAVVLLVGAAGAASDERWLLVAAITAGIAITGAIAWLRNTRWVLLLTGGGVVAWAAALADAIDPGVDWSTPIVLLALSVLALGLAALGWSLDRWSERTDRPFWGVPLWLVAGLVTVWANAVVLSADDLTLGHSLWGWLALANVGYAALSLLAARSMAAPPIRIVTGGWVVLVSACIAAWPNLLLADRLTVALLALAVLIVVLAIIGRRVDLVPGEDLPYEQLLPGVAWVATLVAMVMLAIGWVVGGDLNGLDGELSARWTWVGYALVFALIGLAAGWLSLHPRTLGARERTIGRAFTGGVATGISAGFLTLTALLVTRTASDREAAPVVTLVILGWVIYGLAATLGPRLSTRATLDAWRSAALVVAGLAMIWSIGLPDGGDDLSRRSWLTITLVSLAGMLATEGWLRRQRLLLVAASAVAMGALLIQIEAREPDNILAYSIPLGVYLLALGAVNRRTRDLRDVLLGAGSGVLLVPVLWLAQREGAVGYLALAAGIALALFLGGIVLRLRVPIAAGLLGLTVIVLRLLVDAVLALESWVALLVVGLVLLGAGTAALVWKDALRQRLERIQRGWHDLG